MKLNENDYNDVRSEKSASDNDPKGLSCDKHYGLNLEPESLKLYDAEMILGTPSGTHPEEFQLARNVTIKNQGETGGCLACTLATIAEYYYGQQMSEGWNYGAFRTDGQKNPGLYASTALDAAKNIGQVPKSEFPYMFEMRDIRELTQQHPKIKAIAEKYCIEGYAKLGGSKEKRDLAIKEFLTKYRYPLFAASRDYFHEPHAFTLDGWSDTKDRYKLQNSWGEDEGDGGYDDIPKDEVSEVYALFFEPIALPFKDVPEEYWAYKYIKGMFFNGLINGTSADTFEPDKSITRAEVATVLYRLCEKLDEREIRKGKTDNDVLARIIKLENRIR